MMIIKIIRVVLHNNNNNNNSLINFRLYFSFYYYLLSFPPSYIMITAKQKFLHHTIIIIALFWRYIFFPKSGFVLKTNLPVRDIDKGLRLWLCQVRCRCSTVVGATSRALCPTANTFQSLEPMGLTLVHRAIHI